MLAEGTGEVLDTPGDDEAVRVNRNEFDCITHIVGPQPRIARDNQCILHTQLHFSQGQPRRVFIEILGSRNELEEDSFVDVEAQAF